MAARALTILLITTLFAAGCDPAPKSPEQIRQAIADADIQPVTINGKTFNLEIAATHDKRVQGLSDRESIADDGGMIFVFKAPARRAFVMRRCLVPIDILFLDPDGTIVRSHAMKVEPYDRSELALKRYNSRWPAQFAIELQGGMIEKLGIEDGQTIDLPLDKLKALAE
ncbi:DUF192 domain-containing protein [Mucisphaera calidilacus]|uniref:DUF192 domain-containing protein n=1 Tax=Mucisphaera calidilacus TaxID=2527982 RepID=A0A518BWL9_9BACT|nr:DUF192 domain-containing protein [Mucisphaera calidilacus]QDU71367.1 hypothetical protein Pan265_12160 [Mucisphaera calidilacus]